MFALAPKTPHTRVRNENNTQLGSNRAFPKTPLPSAKQILDSTQSGKPVAGAATHLRKALLDKTPGTHLQNRGLKFAVQTPTGKTTIFIDQKPPSASRKSVKKPRVSANLKTPNPATQKPHWDVIDADISEGIVVQEEKEDDGEPEYMPPAASILPVETEYDFRSGAEIGRMLNDMAHIPYHWYDDTPMSFDDDAFLVPDELLTITLGVLPDEPLPFLSDDEEMKMPATEAPATQIAKPVPAVRPEASRRPPQPITVRSTNARSTVATKKRNPIVTAAIPARRKSATTSALRIPLRTTSRSTASAMARTRAPIRPSAQTAPTPIVQSLRGMLPRAPAGMVKGKGKALPVEANSDDSLRHLPPALRELLEKNEPVFDDFRFDV